MRRVLWFCASSCGARRQSLAHRVAPVPSHQLLLKRRNGGLKMFDLCGEHLQHCTRESRQTHVTLIAYNGDQLADIAQALRRDHAEFGEVRS